MKMLFYWISIENGIVLNHRSIDHCQLIYRFNYISFKLYISLWNKTVFVFACFFNFILLHSSYNEPNKSFCVENRLHHLMLVKLLSLPLKWNWFNFNIDNEMDFFERKQNCWLQIAVLQTISKAYKATRNIDFQQFSSYSALI